MISAARSRRASWVRSLGLALSLGLSVLLGLGAALGQDMQFFRIGTGATNGTYFPVGSMIATAISNPPGSRPCSRGGSCGVPGLIAVAQSTQGSIENVEAVATGQLESALVQADIVYWAYHGTGLFQDRGPLPDLRAIANLFSSTVHIVVRAESGISAITELRGRRVSLGETNSGDLVLAKTILAAYGMTEDNITPFYDKPGTASDMLHEGEIDAFFVAGGVPVPAVADLANRISIRLLPITGTTGEELKTFYPFFAAAEIPAGTYHNVGHDISVGVATQWIVSGDADPEFIYEVTKAFWNERSQALFEKGHPEGRNIRLETALDRVAIPLHPGAARFYEELGIER